MNVLSLNAGSSSLKVALFAIDAHREECLARGAFERIGKEGGSITLKDSRAQPSIVREESCVDHLAALDALLNALERASLPAVDAFGHRLVHGGPEHRAPVIVDASVRASLTSLVRYAPLHLPSELGVLDAVTARFPAAPQVACFDTAFHRGLPEVAERFALPRSLFDEGVRRYGFHGLSYEYIVETIGAQNLRRTVIAHLGNGASMAAVRDGRPIDTTMGLTPAGGLIMGTRSGDLDPGVLVHLMDHHGCGARELETLLNERSGLLGVSGTTGDMKKLVEASAHDAAAALAVEMFCTTARKFVGALAATLGGLDTLVFTGGIGERAAPVRERICTGLGHLGIVLDLDRNARSEACISAGHSPCRVLVTPTDEERMIARHAVRILA